MQALIAYKRTVGEHTQVGFEVRSMTCFNGFNVANAFGNVPNNRLDLTVDLSVVGTQALKLGEEADSVDIQWECIGMGWLSNLINVNCDVSHMLDYPIDYSGNREHLASLLNAEHVTKRMLSMRSFGITDGYREQTPNELLIAQALGLVENQRRDRISAAAFNNLKQSKMYAAVILNSLHQRSLYDFVGSERSSGMAVAYLQVYRNTSQNILSNGNLTKLQGVAPILSNLDIGCSHLGRTLKSVMPILSQLFNAGGDSDIFSFAETPFVALQAMKYGTFSLNQYFGDSRPMTTEGRYSKGSQSLNLQQNISRAARERNLNPELHRIKLVELYKAQQTLAASFSPSSFFSGSLENQKRTVMTAFDRAMAITSNPSTSGAECRTILSSFVDLRTPLVPVAVPPSVAASRSAGAAAGFQVWVAQNDNLAAAVPTGTLAG